MVDMSNVDDTRATGASAEERARMEEAARDAEAEGVGAAKTEDSHTGVTEAVDEAPRDEVSALGQELVAERQRAETYLNDLKRVQADFINFKRRSENEQVEKARFANARLILNILPVLDDLERALDSAGPNLAGLHWVQGINLISRKLRSTLESEGISKIEALGQEFDPRYHEAVVYEESRPEDAGKVIDVLQTGYTLHDRVIRPAIVKVGKGDAG
jgi:molecular chaperone GrpE